MEELGLIFGILVWFWFPFGVGLIGKKLRWWDSVNGTFVGGISVILLLLQIAIGSAMPGTPYEELVNSEENIVALKDVNTVTMDQSKYYVSLSSDICINYMVENNDGSESPVQVCSDAPEGVKGIKIYEGDFSPRIDDILVLRECREPVLKIVFALPCSMLGSLSGYHLYHVYVPEGTVVRDYKIDLE